MSKWEELIAELGTLTRRKELAWESSAEASKPNFDRPRMKGYAYFTKLDDQEIAVYEASFPSWDGEMDEYYEKFVGVAEFVSSTGMLEFRLPADATELLNTVRRRVSRADDFADRLLKRRDERVREELEKRPSREGRGEKK